MNSDELKVLLADVITPISAIERKTGIPKNVLQQSLKGKRTLPKEWVIRLQDFVEKKQYIGLRRKPRVEVKNLNKQSTGVTQKVEPNVANNESIDTMSELEKQFQELLKQQKDGKNRK